MEINNQCLKTNRTTFQSQQKTNFVIFDKFKFISNNLGRLSTDEICGTIVAGTPITPAEISFVITKLRDEGVDV